MPEGYSPPELTAEEARVLTLLHTHTYENVRAETGWSRGRIYQLALRTGARKTEQRIRERAEERRQRQEETFRQIIGSTAKADVLDFLDSIPDESVQLCLFSPPYNVGKDYGAAPGADAMRAVYYHGWIMQVLSEAARILKPGGTLFLQVGSTRDWQDRLMPLDVLLYEDIRRTGLTFQSRVVWTLPHGLTPKNRLAERYETAIVWSKGEQHTVFNPTPARAPQKQPDKRAFKGPRKGQLSGHPLGAWPTNVWSDIPSVRHNHPERAHGAHPAQFPKALARRAILIYTRAGDLVCDPFSGSGTTQESCVETHRAFVGADLFYEDIRARRLAVAAPDTYSPLPGVSDATAAIWQAEARRVDIPAPANPPADPPIGDLFGAS